VKAGTCRQCVLRDIKILNVEADIVASALTSDPKGQLAAPLIDWLRQKRVWEHYTLSPSVSELVGAPKPEADLRPLPPDAEEEKEDVTYECVEADDDHVYVSGTLRPKSSIIYLDDGVNFKFADALAPTLGTSPYPVTMLSGVAMVPTESRKPRPEKKKREEKKRLPPLEDFTPFACEVLLAWPRRFPLIEFEETITEKVMVQLEEDNLEGKRNIESSIPTSMGLFASSGASPQKSSIGLSMAISGEIYIPVDITLKGRYLDCKRQGYIDLVMSRASHCPGKNEWKTEVVDGHCQIHRSAIPKDSKYTSGVMPEPSVPLNWGVNNPGQFVTKAPPLGGLDELERQSPEDRAKWASDHPAYTMWAGADVKPPIRDLKSSIDPKVMDLLITSYGDRVSNKVLRKYANKTLEEAKEVICGSESKKPKEPRPIEVKTFDAPKTMEDMFTRLISEMDKRFDSFKKGNPPQRQAPKRPRPEGSADGPEPNSGPQAGNAKTRRDRKRKEKKGNTGKGDASNAPPERNRNPDKGRQSGDTPKPNGDRRQRDKPNRQGSPDRASQASTGGTSPRGGDKRTGPLFKDEKNNELIRKAFGTTDFPKIVGIIRDNLKSGTRKMDFLKCSKFFEGGKLITGKQWSVDRLVLKPKGESRASS